MPKTKEYHGFEELPPLHGRVQGVVRCVRCGEVVPLSAKGALLPRWRERHIKDHKDMDTWNAQSQ